MQPVIEPELYRYVYTMELLPVLIGLTILILAVWFGIYKSFRKSILVVIIFLMLLLWFGLGIERSRESAGLGFDRARPQAVRQLLGKKLIRFDL